MRWIKGQFAQTIIAAFLLMVAVSPVAAVVAKAAGTQPATVRKSAVDRVGAGAGKGVGQLTDAQINAAYQRMLHLHGDEASFQAFQHRLDLVEQVCTKIKAAFEVQRRKALGTLPHQTPHAPKTQFTGTSNANSDANSTANMDGNPPLTAVDLLRQYEAAFSQPLPVTGLSSQEKQVLQARYVQEIQSCNRHIAQRGKALAAADPKQAMRAMAFLLVFPMLHVPDDQWSASDLAGLPRWMRQPDDLRQLEDFALRARRPLTAYVFAAQALRGSSDGKKINRASYLHTTADQLLHEQRYDDALACLDAQQGLARKAEDTKQVAKITLHAAKVLDDTGQPEQAANRIHALLAGPVPATIYGQAAMFRLKYLYEIKAYRRILDESVQYRSKDRIKRYLPQVLYITWAAAKQDGAEQLATQLRKTFLEKFPSNVLGAEMYFAQAMDALASIQYNRADQLLGYIAFRYPKSRLMPLVKQIRRKFN